MTTIWFLLGNGPNTSTAVLFVEVNDLFKLPATKVTHRDPSSFGTITAQDTHGTSSLLRCSSVMPFLTISSRVCNPRGNCHKFYFFMDITDLVINLILICLNCFYYPPNLKLISLNLVNIGSKICSQS